MPVKHYILTGRVMSVDADTKVMTVTLPNPRPWSTCTVSQFHITLAHADVAQQFTLCSDALTQTSTSENRQLRHDSNEEITGANLGHLRCISYDATIGHYELTQPVTLHYGNTAERLVSVDFYVTDNAGNVNTLLTNVTESINRYAFAGAWTWDADNTAQAGNLTQTWGPNEQEGTGGAFDLPNNDSQWSFNYNTNKITIKWENDNDQKIIADWSPDSAVFKFASESWASGFGFNVGDPVLTWTDYINNFNEVPYEVEINSQYPYCSAKLSVDALH